jgi:hypothetical protein
MRKGTPWLEITLLILLLGILVSLVLAQANPLYHAPNRDGGLFMYAGNQVLKGKILYVDIVDNKGPLIFYLNALGMFLGRGYRWGVWGVEFLFLFSAAFIGFHLMKWMWGLVPAIFGTFLWLGGLTNVLRGGNFTEDYSLLFNFLALYLFWIDLQKKQKWSYLFLIGVMLGLNFLLRANNIGVELSIGLVVVVSAFLDGEYSRSFKKLAWMGAGTVAVFILVAIYFFLLGNLEETISFAYFYNFFYSSDAEGNLLNSFMRGLEFLGYPFVMFALLGFVVLFEKLPEAIRTGQKVERNLYLLFIIGWPIEVVLSGLSGRNYPHYFICWLPYIAFLSGLVAKLVVPVINDTLEKRAMISLSITILFLGVANLSALDEYKATLQRILFERSEGIESVDPIAKYIRDNTQPSDTVLVWGIQPHINLMARRDSSTGILSYPEIVDSPFSEELNGRYFQDLIRNKPILIVDMVNPDNDSIPHIDPVLRASQEKRLRRFKSPSNLDAVFGHIFENYHLETKIGSVMIYRLNETIP